jgi:aspartyl-tRNA synthetase
MNELATQFRTHTCGDLRPGDEGAEAVLSGHVDRVLAEGRRFLIRDRYGKTLVATHEQADAETARRFAGLNPEDVVKVEGLVALRDEEERDEKEPAGAVLLEAKAIEVLSAAAPLPEGILDAEEVSLEDRLAFRQLYLRRQEMQARLELRSRLAQAIREYLVGEGFLEIETPHLFWYDRVALASEPIPVEGGKAFALPSGGLVLDQYIVAGQVERFFQLLRVTRRELRTVTPMHAPEHTLLDLNLLYVDVPDFCRVVEGLLAHVFRTVAGVELETPFPTCTYHEALEKFGTDKPDLRRARAEDGEHAEKGKREHAPVWITDYPMLMEDKGTLVPGVVVFTEPQDGAVGDFAENPEAREKVIGKAFDLVIDGVEVASAYIGNHDLRIQRLVWDEIYRFSTPDLVRVRAPLEAHRFGVPPHGGMNLGFDRLVALILGLDSIDEAMFFPKTSGCTDPLLSAPGPVPLEAVKDIVGEAPPAGPADAELVQETVEL